MKHSQHIFLAIPSHCFFLWLFLSVTEYVLCKANSPCVKGLHNSDGFNASGNLTELVCKSKAGV